MKYFVKEKNNNYSSDISSGFPQICDKKFII